MADFVEQLRTDPAGYAALALSAAIPAYLLTREHEPSDPAISAGVIASSVLAIAGLVHTSHMISYSQSTEASLRSVGFEATQLRVRAYCLRQASRVICEKTGYLQAYKALCIAKQDRLKFSFLPHI